jgi:hypothetical protein
MSSAEVILVQHNIVPALTFFLSEITRDRSVPGLAHPSSGFSDLDGGVDQTFRVEESVLQPVEVESPLLYPPPIVKGLVDLLNPAVRVNVVEKPHGGGVVFPLGVGSSTLQAVADCLLLFSQFHHSFFFFVSIQP